MCVLVHIRDEAQARDNDKQCDDDDASMKECLFACGIEENFSSSSSSSSLLSFAS